MRQIRELFRLNFGSMLPTSDRQIAAQLGVACSTVAEYLERAHAAGLSWPLLPDLSDAELEERLFARPNIRPGVRWRPEPDWASMHRELKRPGVTLMILWEEYRATHSDGYGYSRFCELYREFEARLAPSMRQPHLAGDKVFVNHSDKTLPIRDPATGAVRPAQLFIAVLGASNYTYAEATWTQTLPDWIDLLRRALKCSRRSRMALARAGMSASAMGAVLIRRGCRAWNVACSGLSGLAMLFQARGTGRVAIRKPRDQKIGSKPPA
ncbi:transposase [Azospirillum sp. TSA2s]|uniref:transposase n=1 Tax=Azospirillum sp. TSA2s TaxID=709810 RepID=UPI0010AAB0E7|nr:transposase [Azospirillum sp. TSA2s]QCG94852.1 transposase [Azospirillum sp. TSA2s]